MGKICTFCKYNESKDKCGLIESMASVKYTERCTCYEPVKNVAPVVHAHWIETEDLSGDHYVECSNCCLHWWISGESSKEAEMNYCPRCGARMDEEVDNA